MAYFGYDDGDGYRVNDGIIRDTSNLERAAIRFKSEWEQVYDDYPLYGDVVKTLEAIKDPSIADAHADRLREASINGASVAWLVDRLWRLPL